MLTGGIIVAGGSGSRFGGKIPKQFLPLGSQIVLAHSVRKFLSLCDVVVVAVHPGWVRKIRGKLPRNSRLLFCAGGPTRQVSVLNGLLFLKDQEPRPELVAIHDGARPLFSADLLKAALSRASKTGSAVPVIPVSSTLCRAENGRISGFVDRDGIYQVQTPQVFRFADILQAHLAARDAGQTNATDDSSLFEMDRRPVDIIDGEVSNIKITTPLDLAMARGILQQTRKGH